jgi:hypothetical protein
MSKLFAAFLGLMLGLWQLRDVIAGIFEGDKLAPGEKIKHQFFFWSSHADLVLMTIGLEGWTDQAPAAVAALIERTAANLGAPYHSTAGRYGCARRVRMVTMRFFWRTA